MFIPIYYYLLINNLIKSNRWNFNLVQRVLPVQKRVAWVCAKFDVWS